MVADAQEPEIIWHNYVYDAFGDATIWGPPNILGYLASVSAQGVLEVDAWKTCYVKVWWQRSEHPWYFAHDFYVEHFNHIHRHWARYFNPGQGLTDRISLEIQIWYWSREGGWDYHDYTKIAVGAPDPEIIRRNYVDVEFGDVNTWGPPNILGYLASVTAYGVLEVDAWMTWYVKVWWQKPEHSWYFAYYFYVEHFAHIH